MSNTKKALLVLSKKYSHLGGRPTTYKSEYIDVVKKYAQECIKTNVIPTLSRIQLKLDISRQIFSNWQTNNKEFLDAINQVRNLQKTMLIENAIVKKYDPRFTMFMLNVNHKMIATTQVNTINKNLNYVVHLPVQNDKKDYE